MTESTATETPSPAFGNACTSALDYKIPVSKVGVVGNAITHLIAPAAVLGPNHCPTSFPRSFPANAILWTLNGHNGEGESKNHDINWIYVA